MSALKTFMSKVEAAGLGDPRILEAASFDGPAHLAEMVLADSAFEVNDEVMSMATEMLAGVGLQADLARRRRRAPGDEQLHDSWLFEVAEKKRRLAGESTAPRQQTGSSSAGGPRPSAAWRPRATLPGNVDGLVAQDRSARKKWAKRLVVALRAGGAPALVLADGASDPEAAALGLAGRARPSTVRKRVRTWGVFARWLQWSRGRQWPASPVDYVDYLAATLEDGGSPSFPEGFRAAVMWMESRSGHTLETRFGTHELVRRNVDQWVVDLGSDAPGRRQAPRLPLVALASLECHVMEEKATTVGRVVAWCRLLKVYGVLRQDHLQRLRPVVISLGQGGLTARLLQSKTSGAGKKTRELPVYVPKDFYVAIPEWLETGFGLWVGLGPQGRDYFLPRPDAAMEHFTHRMTKVNDFPVLLRGVLRELKVPVPSPLSASGWESSGKRLIPEVLLAGWTGHSERCTLPSILAAAGVPKSERDPLGRWSPSGSDDYVRTYRAVVRSLAKKFRTAACSASAFTDLDEEDAICGARKFASRCGVGSPEEMEQAVRDLVDTAKYFTGELSASPGSTAPLERAGATRLDERPAEAEACGEEAAEPEGLYVISVSGTGAGHKAKHARLHRRDGCYRARQLRFHDYEILDFSLVPEELYNSICKVCWPSGVLDAEVGSDSTSSSSSRSASPTEEE